MKSISLEEFRTKLCKYFSETNKTTDLRKKLISTDDIIFLHCITKIKRPIPDMPEKFSDYWYVLQSILEKERLNFEVEELINKIMYFFKGLSYVDVTTETDNEGTITTTTTYNNVITNFQYNNDFFEITFSMEFINIV